MVIEVISWSTMHQNNFSFTGTRDEIRTILLFTDEMKLLTKKTLTIDTNILCKLIAEHYTRFDS